MKRLLLSYYKEGNDSTDHGQKPQQHVRQINPSGILHPLRIRALIPLLLTETPMQVYLAEYAEECEP